MYVCVRHVHTYVNTVRDVIYACGVDRALMDVLVTPMQERMEDWKKAVVQLDKEHTKG